MDDEEDFGVCEVCGMPLMQRGGYGGVTRMCGPCTTGEAETLGEVAFPADGDD